MVNSAEGFNADQVIKKVFQRFTEIDQRVQALLKERERLEITLATLKEFHENRNVFEDIDQMARAMQEQEQSHDDMQQQVTVKSMILTSLKKRPMALNELHDELAEQGRDISRSSLSVTLSQMKKNQLVLHHDNVWYWSGH